MPKVSTQRRAASPADAAGSGNRARVEADAACATGAATASASTGAAHSSGAQPRPSKVNAARPAMTNIHSGISGKDSSVSGEASYSDW